MIIGIAACIGIDLFGPCTCLNPIMGGAEVPCQPFSAGFFTSNNSCS